MTPTEEDRRLVLEWCSKEGVLLDPARRESLAAFRAEARRERDEEWWDAVGGVDTVDATPEACKRWQISLHELSKAEEREACERIVEEIPCDCPDFGQHECRRCRALTRLRERAK